MAMATDHDDRFDHEGDTTRTQAERDEAEMIVSKVDELRTLLRDTVRTIGRELHAIRMLDYRTSPRAAPNSPQEAIEGAVEEADFAIFQALLDEDALSDQKAIADGSDD